MKTEVSAAPSKSAAVMDFLQLWRLFTASAAVDAALTKFLHDDTFGERLVKQCDEILDFLDKNATSPLIDILALANAMLNIYATVVLDNPSEDDPEYAFLTAWVKRRKKEAKE